MLPLRGGLAPLTIASSVAVIPWYLSSGISAANCIAAYAPKGAASLAASYVNLVNPGTYDANPLVAPTLGANGWGGTGTQYLSTGIVPSAGYTFIVRFSGVPTDNNGCAMGGFKNSSTYFFMYPSTPTGNRYYFAYGGSASQGAAGTGVASGVMAIAGGARYLNGSLIATSGTWTGTGAAIYIMARNNNGTMDSPMTGNIQAAAIYNTTLTLAQVQAITTAMNAL